MFVNSAFLPAELGLALVYPQSQPDGDNPALRCRHLTQLAHLRPMDKQRWFTALAQVVHADQTLADEEVALLTLLARVMQLPEARLEAALETQSHSRGGWQARPVSRPADGKAV